MKILFQLSFFFLVSITALAQVEYEKQGKNYADIKIVMNRENFKMSDGDHKQLIGLYLSAKPVSILNGLERFDVAPFEIHVRADKNLSDLKLAEIRAAALRYFYIERSQGLSFSTDNKFAEFDYRDYGVNDVPSANFQILDFAIGESKSGLRYTTKDGTYFVIGAVGGVGLGGRLKGDFEAAGLNIEDLVPEALPGVNYNSYSNIMVKGGGFAEINFNEKFKLFGSTKWSSRANTDRYDYNVIEEGNEKSKNLILTSKRFNAEVKIESDLGRLLTPYLTGVSLNAGINLNRFQIEQITKDKYEVNTLKPRSMVMDINQNQYKVGITLSPTTIIKRAQKARKYQEMLNF